ncbi:hypothetical protein FXB41_37265 [Bradyrhizobium canariense]|uniref:hypothetical protein n=1 Tax=Bradyrhizobium canariense TaxID=255045 RepID=UPI001CA537CA|nr:hypothetical protein [Bradyrhizobium canariense]MBW5440214.1 hypothetical protein [Bradyrhizobium canariense]
MARKADLTVDPAAEIEADVVRRAGNLPPFVPLPGRSKFTDVKFGFTYEVLLVALTAHEMVAVVKGVTDALGASDRSLDGL